MAAAEEDEEQRLQSALNRCLLSEFKLCVAGVLFGLPISMKFKTQYPWLIGGVVGTLADWRNGYYVTCVPQKEALEKFRVARERDGKSWVKRG